MGFILAACQPNLTSNSSPFFLLYPVHVPPRMLLLTFMLHCPAEPTVLPCSKIYATWFEPGFLILSNKYPLSTFTGDVEMNRHSSEKSSSSCSDMKLPTPFFPRVPPAFTRCLASLAGDCMPQGTNSRGKKVAKINWTMSSSPRFVSLNNVFIS